MKKILLTGLLACSAFAVCSQRIIPKVGISVYRASVHDKFAEYDEVNPRVGLTAGIGYELGIGEKVWLQPEINFIQKGFVYKHEHTDQGEDSYELNKYTLTVRYIEVPVQVKIKLTSNIHVLVGPSVGYGISGKLRQEYQYDNGTTHLGFDRTHAVKFEDVPDGYASDTNTFQFVNNRIDVGFQLGAGIALFNSLILEARYSMGFTRLYGTRAEIYQFEHADQAKNRVLQFTVGVPINAGK